RTVKLKSWESISLTLGTEKKTFADKIEVDVLEVMIADPTNFRLRTAYGSNLTMFKDLDGKVIPADKAVMDVMRGGPPVFTLDATGKFLSHKMERGMPVAADTKVRESVMDNYEQMCKSLEAVMVPMPNRM